jgi:hypothetical protein
MSRTMKNRFFSPGCSTEHIVPETDDDERKRKRRKMM